MEGVLQLRVRLWRRGRSGNAEGEPIVDCQSDLAAVETGGQGWKGPWKAKAAMQQPLRTLVRAPINPDVIFSWLPSAFRPNGL